MVSKMDIYISKLIGYVFMINQKTELPPSQNTENQQKTPKDYKSRIQTTRQTIINIKSTGYDIQEALEFFPQLIKENMENKRKYQDLTQRTEYTMDVVTKSAEELTQATRINRRLRRAIMVLHGDDYWKIIQKAERGYYELLDSESV